MNVNESNYLRVSGPDVNSVLNAIKGGPFTNPFYHTVHDVHICPERVIAEPAGADDTWRLKHWGTRQLLRDSQSITRRGTDQVVICFESYLSPPRLLILKLSTMFSDHEFELYSVADYDEGYVPGYTFV